MKTLIITDTHNEDPLPLIHSLLKKDIEKIVCLGDVDRPAVLEKIFELDIEKRFVISNHEYYNAMDFPMDDTGLTPEAHKLLWERYPDVKSKILNNSEKVEAKDIGAMVIENTSDNLHQKIVYVHGSIRHDDPYLMMNDRLITGDKERDKNSRIETFKKMCEKDYWLLFRGHDHIKHIMNIPKENYEDINIDYYNDVIELNPEKRYIITFGSFNLDLRSNKQEYAIFDEDKKIIYFKKL
jgi:hypothetical protein